MRLIFFLLHDAKFWTVHTTTDRWTGNRGENVVGADTFIILKSFLSKGKRHVYLKQCHWYINRNPAFLFVDPKHFTGFEHKTGTETPWKQLLLSEGWIFLILWDIPWDTASQGMKHCFPWAQHCPTPLWPFWCITTARDTHHNIISILLRSSSLSGISPACLSLHFSETASVCVECSYEANIKLEHKNVSTCIFRMALSVFLISTN